MNARKQLAVFVLSGVVCFGCGPSVLGAEEGVTSGQITFHNGDTLTGQLSGLDSETGTLEWAYPDSPAPFRFDLDAVSHVLLRSTTALIGQSRPLFRLTLTDGDTLLGVVKSLDEESLHFDAGLPDALTVPRRHVHRLDAALNAAQLLYDGPNGPDEWEVGYRGRNWQFEKGHLISESYSSTGRQLNIPRRARIELDVTLRDDPTLNLFLCADNPRNGGDSYYYLQLTPNTINCQRYWRDHPRTYINLNKEYENKGAKALFLGQPQVHLAIEIDREAKRLKLFVNGQLYATFRDPAPEAPAGSSMILASYGNGSVRAEAIRVYALERLTTTPRELAPHTTVLRDADSSWTGTLTSNGSTLQVGDSSAGLDQMLAASLADRKEETPPDASPVRFFLSSGGQLGGPARLEGDTLRLAHPLLGPLELPLSLVDGLIRAKQMLPQAQAQAPPPRVASQVLFKNGDRLAGTLQGWDNDGGLRWRWTDRSEPLAFPARSVAEVHLPYTNRPPAPARSVVHLSSGDVIPGAIAALSPTELVLKTDFSQVMHIPIPIVRKVAFHDPASIYFRGPGPLQDWKTIGSDGEWHQDVDGALVGRGSGGVSHPMPMPTRGQVEVELSWKGQLDASLTLFARDLRRTVQPKTYRLHCENERITLYRGLSDAEVARDQDDADPLRNRRLAEQLERFAAQFGGGAIRRLGSPVSVPFKAFKRSREIALFWDQEKAVLALRVDGEVLRTWEDPDGLVPPSNGLILNQHSQASTLRLLSIAVRDWNGILPDPPLDAQTTQNLTSTVVRLRNQDEFLASAPEMQDSTAPLRFDSALGRLALPTDRLEFLQFPKTDYPIAHALGMVLDGHLTPEGHCRFFLSRIGDGQLAVASPYFGENVLELSAFGKLVFDLQDRAYWDRPTVPWPRAVPVSMRPAVQQRQAAQAAARKAKTAQDQATRYNESVELDE